MELLHKFFPEPKFLVCFQDLRGDKNLMTVKPSIIFLVSFVGLQFILKLCSRRHSLRQGQLTLFQHLAV